MRTDFENLKDGNKVRLYPNEQNPLHSTPSEFYYSGGFFFGVDADPVDGPDYYFGDVLKYNDGYNLVLGN